MPMKSKTNQFLRLGRLLLLPVLAHLPYATLAAIVVVAMAGLSDPGYLRRLWTVRRYEFAVSVAAFAGVQWLRRRVLFWEPK